MITDERFHHQIGVRQCGDYGSCGTSFCFHTGNTSRAQKLSRFEATPFGSEIVYRKISLYTMESVLIVAFLARPREHRRRESRKLIQDTLVKNIIPLDA